MNMVRITKSRQPNTNSIKLVSLVEAWLNLRFYRSFGHTHVILITFRCWPTSNNDTRRGCNERPKRAKTKRKNNICKSECHAKAKVLLHLCEAKWTLRSTKYIHSIINDMFKKPVMLSQSRCHRAEREVYYYRLTSQNYLIKLRPTLCLMIYIFMQKRVILFEQRNFSMIFSLY